MLVEAGIQLVKLWLDISKKEQAERLDARRTDPLKALKVSDLDGEAQKTLEGLLRGAQRDAADAPRPTWRPGSACTPTTRRRRG